MDFHGQSHRIELTPDEVCDLIRIEFGHSYAEWDTEAPVTREGQFIFFFQFLNTGGRWNEFLSKCPLSYTDNRGSGADKVMGTVLLSVLSGHWRYVHINGVRGDAINPGLLGIDGGGYFSASSSPFAQIKKVRYLSSRSIERELAGENGKTVVCEDSFFRLNFRPLAGTILGEVISVLRFVRPLRDEDLSGAISGVCS